MDSQVVMKYFGLATAVAVESHESVSRAKTISSKQPFETGLDTFSQDLVTSGH